jgi:hypothetical protein
MAPISGLAAIIILRDFYLSYLRQPLARAIEDVDVLKYDAPSNVALADRAITWLREAPRELSSRASFREVDVVGRNLQVHSFCERSNNSDPTGLQIDYNLVTMLYAFT